MSGSGMPADFQQCLLFERAELHKLKAHIGELAAEKTEQIFLHRNARMRHAMLAKERLDMEKKMRGRAMEGLDNDTLTSFCFRQSHIENVVHSDGSSNAVVALITMIAPSLVSLQ